jgi:gliding motility-associated-like protein
MGGHTDQNDPIFIAGYTTSGTYVRSAILPSGGDDQNGIACDAWGNLYLCSDYVYYLILVAGKDTLPRGIGGEYLYVARYSFANDSMQLHNHSNITRCFTGEIELNAPPGYLHYIWSTGDTGLSITVSSPGTYYIYGFDSCSSSSVDSMITISEECLCSTHLFVPNAFTPNGDGQDDVFYPRSGGEIKLISSFRIYNRWGELLFEKEKFLPNDATKAWDGTYKGEPPLSEVYVWVVEGICENGKKFNSKGSVTIIR